MQVTVEVSLYPLTNDYEGLIISFIKKMKNRPHLEVMTHSMSTYIKGEVKEVMSGIGQTMHELGPDIASALVMKVINRNLPVESGYKEFS